LENAKKADTKESTWLPLKLDKIDIAILNILLKDGRAPFRRIATQVGVSTPTAESRLKRMIESGLVKKIAPILDSEKVEGGTAALILLNVDLSKIGSVAGDLAALEEVRNIFVTSGEANMLLRVVTSRNEDLQDFLDSKIANLKGARLVSTQVITRTLKDEQGVAPSEGMLVSLRCDYCRGKVSGKPHIYNVGEGKRFFCCKTCLSEYKEKYALRISALSNA